MTKSHGISESQDRTIEYYCERIRGSLREISISVACIESVCNFLADGIPPGTFVRSVLENKLIRAVKYADKGNQALLSLFVVALMQQMPGNIWSSEEAVSDWIAAGGMRGKYRAENEDQPWIDAEYSTKITQ